MEGGQRPSIFVPLMVAIITGVCAAIPAVLTYLRAPEISREELKRDLQKLEKQSEAELNLQRERSVAAILGKLDDENVHVRSGAALSLAALGEKEVVTPILVGKFREAATELIIMELGQVDGNSPGKLEDQRQFLNSLKQSLLTIGQPALKPLIALNRELRGITKQTAKRGFESPRGKDPSGAIKPGDARFHQIITGHVGANEEVKDLIRGLLLKVSHVAPSEQSSESTLVDAGISLAYADLKGSLLLRINLAGVNLRKADLQRVSLEESDLTRAELKYALLDGAILQEGNFEGADFTGANLFDVKYYRDAKFKGANFSEARINNAKFKQYLSDSGALNVPGMPSAG